MSVRLKDQELILRFLAFFSEGEDYEKPVNEFLNRFVSRHRNPPQRFLDQCEKSFSTMIKTASDALGEKAFRPAGTLNAAVFDSVSVGIAKRLAKGKIRRPAKLEAAYRKLLANNDLRMSGNAYRWLQSDSNAWSEMPEDDTDIELRLRGLSWLENNKCRTMVYNLTVPLFRNNVDICLFDCSAEKISKETHKTACAYIALGELKGGIDPAGADEHWKTAGSALIRIREAFSKRGCKPKTFFIGAAIEARMADEIWNLLKRGVLENAANLTNENQIASITRWLCSL